MTNIIDITDADEFQRAVLNSPVPVVVDFWAEWCGPCSVVAPELAILAASYGEEIRVVKVDVDTHVDIAARYGVMSIPTIVLFRSGERVAASVGAKRARDLEEELGLSDAISAAGGGFHENVE
jgi:thioredoxin